MPRIEQQIDQVENLGDVISILRHDGGLNTEDSNEILKDNESIIRENWSNDTRGALIKVNGFTKKNASAMASAAVLGLHRVYQSSGTKKLLAICGGKLYYSDDDGGTFTQATAGTGLTTSVFSSFVNHNDLAFFTNTANNLYHYTPGTDTMAAATNQPADACRMILKRADKRLLAFVNGTNGSTLYYSKISPTGAAADDWSAANDAGSIAIDGAKSEPLTGGMTYGAFDIIYKHYGAFRVWGYPTPEATRMPGSPGCIAPQSVSTGDGYGFHLAHDGIYLWDGNKWLNISGPIDSIIDDIATSNAENTFTVYRNGYLWVFYTPTGQAAHTKCVIYDVARSNPYAGQNIWFERPGLAMNCPVIFSGAGDDNEIYAGAAAATGYVFRLDYSTTGTDNGSDIEAVVQTKYFNAGYPKLVKRFSKIYIRYYLPAGNLLVNWYTNRGQTSGSYEIVSNQTGVALGEFELDVDRLAGFTEALSVQALPDNAVGRDISIKITSTESGDAPIIRDIQIDWEALYVE